MKDPRLSALNFHDLLDYGDQPIIPQFKAHPEYTCSGFCVSCEESGLLERTGKHLDLMSHGCDSSDFEAILGPMPVEGEGPRIEEPILFLLENPGGDRNNGKPIPFRGIQKQPPVYHYYWTPHVTAWPSSIQDIGDSFYGSYFAYLMRKFQLTNVYITNLVKCKLADLQHPNAGKNRNAQVVVDHVDHCVEKYLRREVQVFRPRVAFCFGRKAERGLQKRLGRIDHKCEIRYLWHPSAIRLPWRHGKTRDELIGLNDECIREEIKHLG